MVIESVSPVAEAETAAAMMSAWIVRLLNARLDQVGAKLIDQQEADDQHHEAAEIQNNDAAGERRREPRGQESPGDARAQSQPSMASARRRGGKATIELRFGAHVRGRAAYPSLNRYPTP